MSPSVVHFADIPAAYYLRFGLVIGNAKLIYGGGSRVRTGDPMLAKHVLYQLSYTPKNCHSHYGTLQVLDQFALLWLPRWFQCCGVPSLRNRMLSAYISFSRFYCFILLAQAKITKLVSGSSPLYLRCRFSILPLMHKQGYWIIFALRFQAYIANRFLSDDIYIAEGFVSFSVSIPPWNVTAQVILT